MQNSLGRIMLLWAMVIVTLWLGHMLYRDLFLTADAPRAVTARGELAEFEALNIELFERISPSVAYIFVQGPSGRLFGRAD